MWLVLGLHVSGTLSQCGPGGKLTPKEHWIVFRYLVCALNRVYNVFMISLGILLVEGFYGQIPTM